ncbi:MAG: lytic transglycosylase domain-containing protein [Kiritimatiellia bacterium]|nr:lytic transglycosylase domain-containing protein [Kiritimatiellia bacterium]
MLKMSNSSSRIRFYFLVVLLAAFGLVLVFGISRYRRIHAYDDIIAKTAASHSLDPKLIRAVIWRESRFKYNCRGKRGEIGLMQVTENAAKEWAEANGIANLRKNDLFNPETNIQAGTWYLKRSISRWSNKNTPLPYALAEYNAGRSNAVRWAASDDGDANKFWHGITYPSTKRYVRDILTRLRRSH